MVSEVGLVCVVPVVNANGVRQDGASEVAEGQFLRSISSKFLSVKRQLQLSLRWVNWLSSCGGWCQSARPEKLLYPVGDRCQSTRDRFDRRRCCWPFRTEVSANEVPLRPEKFEFCQPWVSPGHCCASSSADAVGLQNLQPPGNPFYAGEVAWLFCWFGESRVSYSSSRCIAIVLVLKIPSNSLCCLGELIQRTLLTECISVYNCTVLSCMFYSAYLCICVGRPMCLLSPTDLIIDNTVCLVLMFYVHYWCIDVYVP
jgi:hypothetical protein